jgi:2-succinyl-5-enolpyruvyl-6-hydroxy-3-cyclohexene-1-carboxylate synthase
LFFSQFFFLTKHRPSSYQAQWVAVKKQRKIRHRDFIEKVDYADILVFDKVLKRIPKHSNLQLANSSVIRYSQLFDLDATLKVFCNRGTSGIDGSTSTAIGAACTQQERTVFITGDISFFYDSNALWNKYIPKNFRIVLINNGGGGIFRFIPGPKASDALDFFETTHNLNASELCKMFGFAYASVHHEEALNEELKTFYKESDKPKLLEIFTPTERNDVFLKAYFNALI